jgi:hypothetical protein
VRGLGEATHYERVHWTTVADGCVVQRWAIPTSPLLVTADAGRSGAQRGHTGQMWRASDVKDTDVVCIRAIEK